MILAALVAVTIDGMILLLVLGAVAILFSILTVSVEEECGRLWCGPGFIHKQFALPDIESCEVAQPGWALGDLCVDSKVWVRPGFRPVELKIRNAINTISGPTILGWWRKPFKGRRGVLH